MGGVEAHRAAEGAHHRQGTHVELFVDKQSGDAALTAKDFDKAFRAYKDLNLWALKRLNPQGILFTFSCSGNFQLADFKQMLAYCAKDLNIDLQFIEFLHQSPDHPIRASVPETEYLKGVICKI